MVDSKHNVHPEESGIALVKHDLVERDTVLGNRHLVQKRNDIQRKACRAIFQSLESLVLNVEIDIVIGQEPVLDRNFACWIGR